MNAKEQLRRQIRAGQTKLDPEIRRRAELIDQGHVPYDKAAARSAVAKFLEGRPENDRLRREITRLVVRKD